MDNTHSCRNQTKQITPVDCVATTHTHTHTHTHTICKQTDEQHNAGSECQFLISWSSNKTEHVQRQ